jgi:hypothetical protein
MKKLILACAALVSVSGFAQSNTFPTPSGNVGIGNGSPITKLQVQADNNATWDVGQLLISGQTNPNKRLSLGFDTTYNFGFLQSLIAADNYYSLVLQPHGGSVGIGTTPSAKFEVAGGSGSTGVQSFFSVQTGFSAPSPGNVAFAGGTKLVLWNDVTTPQKLSIGMDANADMWFNNAGGQGGAGFTFYTGNGGNSAPVARFKITKEGNVGIGTPTPSAKFEVWGDIRAYRDGSDGINAQLYFANAANNRAWNWQLASAGDSAFWGYDGTSWGEKLRIQQNGNVGIGTTNPTQKLSVNGTVRAHEVIVDTGWSDFVFDESYKLTALSETEAFVKAEKHLPGIPSAKEVAENGISVGEMQAKLLAKIEELTLHQIAEAKELATVKSENDSLRRRMTELESHLPHE